MPDTALKTITFSLDGRDVTAFPGESIWQVAKREGTTIPHLCWQPEPGYRADGNCRACMVEIEGERTLAASCIRTPSEGMVVKSASDRAKASRDMVFELLLADQPAREVAHETDSKFWTWIDKMDVETSRFPQRATPETDASHAAMRVNLDACIHCNLCVRACREVQINDVIGMAYRGHGAKIVFDFDDPMGQSTCVACGECVQACPTGALMPATKVDESQVYVGAADSIVDSVCPFCGVGCQTEIHVKDNKIVEVRGKNGPANEQRLCVKGRFGMDYSSHAGRLTKPLIRRKDAEKRWDIEVDPMNPLTHFREATWEEAIEVAVSGLRKIRDDKGGDALAGFGSAKGSNEEAYLFQKLVRTGFETNNVDHCTRLCHASSVAALMEGVNSGAVTAPFTAAKDADCMIVIGARPAQNHPVAATFLKQAVKRGAKMIVLDPRGQDLARHAWKHLQFTPGRDVPLLNAMIHTIIYENLVDEQFIQARVENYQAVKENVRPFSPEEMAPICGIDAETIREVARVYARSEKSIIFWGMGVSQHVHGTDNARCLITLAAITGQIGRPGTGLHPLRGQNNVQGASDAGLIPMVFPDYKSVENPEIREMYEKFWGQSLDPNRGLTVVEIVDAILAGSINGMYIMGENPAMSDPDTRHARQALAELDHLVVQDIFLTETCYHADVIFPASALAEKWGTFTNTNRQVQIGRPALTPPGDARQDWELIQAIAQGLGLNWNYSHPKEVFAEMGRIMQSFNGITWDRLENEGAVTYPCDDETTPGHEIIFAESFPTANGRVKLTPTDLVPPSELPDADYPMVLTTGRLLEHWHTGAMTRRATVLDILEPEAVAHLHPRWLAKHGVKPGDMVAVHTRRGAVKVKARADRDVTEDMVFMPFCFAEGPANMLTNPQLDPFGKIPEFKFCAARVAPLVQVSEAAE
ncbi:formate dehydrogenase subunit alpha [Hwanghaeella sp. 1Z406]|jgi:formate dehydrogenase major subunit|uniref:formate dehydrogenase subunit alpha n=1 Tax=Hwanghaeella sp. 1Z406 TaxID=3402811 RepID=UPI00267BA879|tara:strand:+ start:53381 stop:56164 length:2784 start_codon:yes stop_codon:yes gene_type:complete